MRDKPIYLMVLGEMKQSKYFSMEKLEQFVKLYYPGTEVKILPQMPIEISKKGLFVSYPLSTRGRTKSKNLNSRVAHPFDLDKVESNSRQVIYLIILKRNH
jgi:predicted component of type VI protein secretion system